jgi:hypothetical protein
VLSPATDLLFRCGEQLRPVTEELHADFFGFIGGEQQQPAVLTNASELTEYGDITMDSEGNVTLYEPRRPLLTGWEEPAPRGNPLRAVFHIVNEGSGAEVDNPVDKVIREGVIAGLANHNSADIQGRPAKPDRR